MWDTKFASDNFEMLLTILATFVINIINLSKHASRAVMQ